MPTIGLAILNATRSKGIKDAIKSKSISSTREAVLHFFREPQVANKPTTMPMLKTCEPKMSPMLIPAVPWYTAKIVTVNSGIHVIIAKIINPAATSLNRVISIKSSMYFMAKKLATANTPNEVNSVNAGIISSIIKHTRSKQWNLTTNQHFTNKTVSIP